MEAGIRGVGMAWSLGSVHYGAALPVGCVATTPRDKCIDTEIKEKNIKAGETEENNNNSWWGSVFGSSVMWP